MGLVFFCLLELKMGLFTNRVLFNTSCDKSEQRSAGA